MDEFQVVTTGMPATSAEWFRALNAPDSELPSLSESEIKNAISFHIREEDYARQVLLRRLARQREQADGERIGACVKRLLSELGPEYRLRSVSRRGLESGWRLLIEKEQSRVWDLHFRVDVFGLESGDSSALREQLFRDLGREDALRKTS